MSDQINVTEQYPGSREVRQGETESAEDELPRFTIESYQREVTHLRAELARERERAERAVEAFIDDHGMTCDCCQHVMIDVRPGLLSGDPQHCIAGDSEGEGSACAYTWHEAWGKEQQRAEAAEQALAERDAEIATLREELKEHEDEQWCFNKEHAQYAVELSKTQTENTKLREVLSDASGVLWDFCKGRHPGHEYTSAVYTRVHAALTAQSKEQPIHNDSPERRGHGSGPLPGKDVTVVQEEGKTKFVHGIQKEQPVAASQGVYDRDKHPEYWGLSLRDSPELEVVTGVDIQGSRECPYPICKLVFTDPDAYVEHLTACDYRPKESTHP